MAKDYLKKHDYKLDTAINDYFNKTGGSLSTTISKEIEKLYEKYKEIGIKGLFIRFFVVVKIKKFKKNHHVN